jgi:hypothetical protein
MWCARGGCLTPSSLLLTHAHTRCTTRRAMEPAVARARLACVQAVGSARSRIVCSRVQVLETTFVRLAKRCALCSCSCSFSSRVCTLHLWLARLHTPKCTATSGRVCWFSDDDSATCSTSSRSWPCLSSVCGVAQVRRDTVADNVDPRPPHRAGSGVGGR